MNKDEVDWAYRQDEYMALMHQMQTGVAFTMHRSDEASPKHLRVGVNSAICMVSALVKTLVEADVIIWEDFRDSEIEMLKQDIESYKSRLGGNVELR